MTSLIYLKTNKDYNNKFSEDGKKLKVGRSPDVSLSLLHLPPPPLTDFFSWGRNILYQISGRAYAQLGLCPTFFETGGPYAHSAPRLRMPLPSPHAILSGNNLLEFIWALAVMEYVKLYLSFGSETPLLASLSSHLFTKLHHYVKII